MKNIFKGREHEMLLHVRDMKLYSLAEVRGMVVEGRKLKGFLAYRTVRVSFSKGQRAAEDFKQRSTMIRLE